MERSWEEKKSRSDIDVSPQNNSSYVRPQAEHERAPQSRTNTGAESKATILKQIDTREARLRELFERIYSKRRYVKRQGKKDISRIRRLNGEIEALEKSSPVDSGKIEQLKKERGAAKERLFNENLRTRKGIGEDIREYKKIEAEIQALQNRL